MQFAKRILFLFILSAFFSSAVISQNVTSLKKSMELSRNDTSKINACISLFRYYYQNNADSCLIFSRKAYELSKENQYFRFKEVAKNLGLAYSQKADYEIAIKYQIEAYNYAVKHNDLKACALILTDIGNNYVLLNDFDLAEKYLKEALKISKDYNEKVVAMVNLAQTYIAKDKYSEAEKILLESLSMAQKEKASQDIAVIYNQLGHILYFQNEFSKSILNYKKSLEYLKPSEYYYTISALRGLADNYLEIREYVKSLNVLTKADSLARIAGFIYESEFLNRQLSIIYDSLGNYYKSLYYYKIYNEYDDSIFDIEKMNTLNSLQTEFDSKRKEMQLEILQKESKLHKALTLIYLISAILIISALFLIIKNIRQKNKLLLVEKQNDILEKQKLELQLHERNRELLSNSLLINQQKEVFSNVNSKLEEILKHQEPVKIKNSVFLLQTELKASAKLSDDWDQIKLHFEKVHPHFFNSLSKEYPDLSVNELKLCAYTKLKFSTKDIGRLLNINSSSVHIARYRLKKKMNMPENVNFDEYIISQ
jgi:tetratricopeptide (TPR) repeat protein/DNA-binding CsgD family transcriptional regulator